MATHAVARFQVRTGDLGPRLRVHQANPLADARPAAGDEGNPILQ